MSGTLWRLRALTLITLSVTLPGTQGSLPQSPVQVCVRRKVLCEEVGRPVRLRRIQDSIPRR